MMTDGKALENKNELEYPYYYFSSLSAISSFDLLFIQVRHRQSSSLPIQGIIKIMKKKEERFGCVLF
jgi:hypothetical protein